MSRSCFTRACGGGPITLLFVLAVTACSVPGRIERAVQPAAGAPAPARAVVAEALVPRVSVFETPEQSNPAQRLKNPQPSGTPLVLQVLENRSGWLRVALPVRPNGSTGWVRADEVSLSEHDYRVVIELGTRRLKAFKGADTLLAETVAVGAPDAPTPQGNFYVTELLAPPDPNGAYGPYAFGLSAHSDTYTEFAGGDGVVGLHGTNQPELLGSAVSHGCIRITNAAITKLADLLPLGTPVEIRA